MMYVLGFSIAAALAYSLYWVTQEPEAPEKMQIPDPEKGIVWKALCEQAKAEKEAKDDRTIC